MTMVTLVPILPNEILGRRERPAPQFLAQRGGALPEIGTAGAQSLFEDQAMLGFGAAAVLGGAALQCLDDIERHIANEELGHQNPLTL